MFLRSRQTAGGTFTPSTDVDDSWELNRSTDTTADVYADAVAPVDTHASQPRKFWSPTMGWAIVKWTIVSLPALVAAVALGGVVVSRSDGAATAVHASASATPRPMASSITGTLVVSSHPSGAQVVVDGKDSGVTPVALQLAPGPHAIVLGTTAGVFEQLTADIVAGESLSRHVLLESAPAATTSGGLTIEAVTGAEVSVDDTLVGEAPLEIADLSAGPHVVRIRTASGVTERSVTVVAGTKTSLVFEAAPPAEALSGWITLSLPFNAQVFESGAFVGSNQGDKIRVGAGRHTFEIVNEEFGYFASETVTIAPGRVATLQLAPPLEALSINAQPWAEVFIGGRSYGETPLANVMLPLGLHEVTLRHPTLGERILAASVRLGKPNRLSVDLRQ